MKAASSEARKRTAYPISGGSPKRPTGVVLDRLAITSSLTIPFDCSVRNMPGLIVLTVTPHGATAAARSRVRLSTAPFEVW
jgi:hypothetical protein